MRLALLLCALFLAAGSLVCQEPHPCRTPAHLASELKTSPSASAQNALGAYFAQQHQSSCAVAAFEAAIRLAPDAWEGHYNLGLALLDQGDFKRAETDLRMVVRSRPNWPDGHNALGSALQAEERLEAAALEFRAVLKAQPADAFALQHLSEILIAQRRYTAAIQLLTPPPPDFNLRTNLAIALSKNGKSGEAIAILKQLAAEQPDSAAAHFNLASEFATQKLYRESTGEYREALRLDPANDAARTSLVKAYNILGEYPEALPLIEDYAHRRSDDFDAPYLLGEVYRGLGRYADAVQPLERAVKMQPGHYDALYNLGFVLARENQYQAALPYLEKAVKLRPEGVQARYQLAMALKALNQTERAAKEFAVFDREKQRQGQKDVAAAEGGRANQYLDSGDAQQAVDAYRQSLVSDPGNGRTYYNLALALDRLGDRAAERQALEQAVSLDPALAPAQNQLGLLDLQDGKIAQAESRLMRALSLDPQFAEAQSNLGVLYGQQGNARKAEELFRQATENNPNYAQAFLNLGLVLAGEERFPEAEKQIETAVRLLPGLKGGVTALGMVRARMGRSQDAIASFRQVVAQEPSSPESHLNLGIALADGFDLQGALAEFSKAADLAPNSAAARYNKGRALFDLREYPQAGTELEEACRLAPDYFDALYLLALTEKRTDHSERSAELLQKAVALRPRDADARFLLGQTLLAMGKRREAIAEWKETLEIEPNHAQVLSNLTRVLHESEPAEAERYRERFAALEEKRMVADRSVSLSNLALAAANAHDWEQAISQMHEAVEVCAQCPSEGALHKNLGLIYCRSGNLLEGERQLQTAAKLLPDDPEITRSLGIVHTVREAKNGTRESERSPAP